MRGLRARLSLSVLAVVALAIAAMAVGFNVVLDNRLSSDANSVLRTRTSAELGTLTTVDGKLRVGESPDDAALDAQVWVFVGRNALEGPPASPPKVRRAAARLARGSRTHAEVTDPDVRLLAVPVRHGSEHLGTVVAAVSLKPYEQTRSTARVASLILCGAVLIVVLFMARWTTARALRPVSEMTKQAAMWSEADLDGRFGLGPPHDELTELAATLDRLLERISAVIRHEQRFSTEISHELRTPLAKIRAEAEIALRRRRTPGAYRDALATILIGAERMSAVVDTLLAAARGEADARGATCDAARAAAAAVGMCAELFDRRGVTVTVNGSDRPVHIAADQEVVERILFPLIENGCRYATREVTVEVTTEGRRALVSVRDDGPGVDVDEVSRIFDPGERGRAAGDGEAGAGLGLALARRLARQVGGEVVAEPAPGGRFTVELPRSDA